MRILIWMGSLLLLMAFGLVDAAVIAWSASLVTLGQLASVGAAFVLISGGGLFTVWQMHRAS